MKMVDDVHAALLSSFLGLPASQRIELNTLQQVIGLSIELGSASAWVPRVSVYSTLLVLLLVWGRHALEYSN